jgi:hypothetical protein
MRDWTGRRLELRRGGYEYGGPAFVGAIVAGIGIGILTDDWGWLFVGVGAGFILMGLIAALARK